MHRAARGVNREESRYFQGSRHRGFDSSFQYVTLIGAQLVATLVLIILQQFLSDA